MYLKKISDHRYGLVWLIVVFYTLVSTLTRLCLLLFTGSSKGISFSQGSGLFSLGLLYDLSIASFLIIPFILQIWGRNEWIYKKKNIIPIATSVMLVILLLVLTNIIPKDYNSLIHSILVIYIGTRLCIYLFLSGMSADFRNKWRGLILTVDFFLLSFIALFNAVSEWFFWEEFSTRYNFIAVDYLVYTNEVLGNIQQSYPITSILIVLALISLTVTLLARPIIFKTVRVPMTFKKRTAYSFLLLLFPLVVFLGVKEKWRNFSDSAYANELAGNGVYEFAHAFQQNELDFYTFYKTLPDSTAFRILRSQLQVSDSQYTRPNSFDIERAISYPEPERKLNVVMISVESLSGDFMSSFGNKQNITPYLDSLTKESVFFTKFYASGTRTVRGLEALTLSIPPAPGQSIVKRPNNEGLFSLGSVFKSKGYTTQYIYGGYSYFDNMKSFFSSNGYDVIDRSAIAAKDVHYQNIWGVADEDLFTLTLKTLDDNYKTGKPFFSHVMTVSNHRPFTYPEGRIDIPPSTQSREGAVKYTDYAINRFLKEASTKPWFNQTVFVIVADHCAGSAGSVELPVTGYHIPLLIYAPQILKPRLVTHLTAQIDVAPTILGILNFKYNSKFFGQDALHADSTDERAFISTYQGLGYLKNKQLVIQAPVKNISQYQPDFANGGAKKTTVNDTLSNEAISYYQCISWLLQHRKNAE